MYSSVILYVIARNLVTNICKYSFVEVLVIQKKVCVFKVYNFVRLQRKEL